jgi:hypothetical protein
MKKIALSLVLAAGLGVAACSQPAEEATTEAPEAAAPAEGAMTEAAPAEGAMTEEAAPAEGAMTEAAPAAEAAPAEGAMTEEKK